MNKDSFLKSLVKARVTDPILRDTVQDGLFKKHLEKDIEDIIEELILFVRLCYDKAVSKKIDRLIQEGSFNSNSLIANYPIGCCYEITYGVRNILFELLKSPSFSYESQKLIDFLHDGGRIDLVHGIQHGMYFQNALRLGGINGIIIDTANDTVDSTNDKVVFGKTTEMGFENINSFDRWTEIAKKYWGIEMYPIINLPPIIGMIFPMISIKKDGTIYFEQIPVVLARKNFLSGYKLSRDYLFSESKPLPDVVSKLLSKHCNAKLLGLDDSFENDIQRLINSEGFTRDQFDSCVVGLKNSGYGLRSIYGNVYNFIDGFNKLNLNTQK